MTIDPSTWLAAQASIAAAIAQPYLHAEEQIVGRRYSAELDDAIRRYGVGGAYFHESADPAATNFGPITTVPQARDFLRGLPTQLNQHFASYAAHWRPTQRTIAPDSDPYSLANAIAGSYAAHRVEPSVHFNDDTVNVVSAPPATDDASLIVLAEALRVATSQHVRTAGKIVITQTIADSRQYQQALRDFEKRRADTLALVAYAERVARAAQAGTGFVFSGGLPHEATPYGKLPATFENASKIRDRIQNIWESGEPFTADPYVVDVVLRAAALLVGIGPREPTPPAPPGQSTLVVQGVISSGAEAALTIAVTKVNKFAAAAAVQ